MGTDVTEGQKSDRKPLPPHTPALSNLHAAIFEYGLKFDQGVILH